MDAIESTSNGFFLAADPVRGYNGSHALDGAFAGGGFRSQATTELVTASQPKR
jgi:hypothetical protein